MAFRRQDIPKTTRKGKDGEGRRIYPRYLRDGSYLPKIEMAIGYLDGMVGRRRGDLSADAVLDLLGDPKLARCVLSCLAETYRYRTPEFVEIVGDDAAERLAAWDLFTSADVRAFVYAALNERSQGVIEPATRAEFLASIGETLGVDDDVLDQLLHADAERNEILMRIGDRPEAVDVVARYNALLTFSVLRQASHIDLTLSGLSGSTVEAVCARWGVSCRRMGREDWRFGGKRDAFGSWARFGVKLARAATHLMMLAPEAPVGEATVHLNDQTSRLVIDTKVTATLRPKQRAVAGPDGVIRAAILAEELSAARRVTGDVSRGWTVRRATEPIVVENVSVLPEFICVRDQTVVALVAGESGESKRSHAAVRAVHGKRPVIAFGFSSEIGDVPVATTPAEIWSVLDRLDATLMPRSTPVERLRDELLATGWVKEERVDDVLGGDAQRRLKPLVDEGEAAVVPGFGLCRITMLEEWGDRFLTGSVDVRGLRRELMATIGDAASADALALHLLSRQSLYADGPEPVAA
jgi:predicted nuclease of restriction endonuclease-like RecB superfamily